MVPLAGEGLFAFSGPSTARPGRATAGIAASPGCCLGKPMIYGPGQRVFKTLRACPKSVCDV